MALGGILKDSGASAVLANTIASWLGMGETLGIGSWILVIASLGAFVILLTDYK